MDSFAEPAPVGAEPVIGRAHSRDPVAPTRWLHPGYAYSAAVTVFSGTLAPAP